jgi:hypothetical protein
MNSFTRRRDYVCNGRIYFWGKILYHIPKKFILIHFSSLFNDAVSNSDQIASNDKLMSYELERMW